MDTTTSKARELGLLAVRLGFGGAAFSHGAQKLFGWFGGGGLEGTGAFFQSAGFTPGRRNALFSGLAEAGGGAAIALGLATGPAGAAMTGNMVVASSTHVENGFFAQGGGLELPSLYALVGTALTLSGGGRYSLGAVTGRVLDKPWMRVLAYGAAVGSAVYLISARKQELASRPQPEEEADAAAEEAQAQD